MNKKWWQNGTGVMASTAYEGKEENAGHSIVLPQKFSESWEGPQSSPSHKALISLLLL